ncbi:MAG TPA: multicopper oxidase domain-containing protein, partial [Polyangiaceae bacterium]
IVNASNGRDFKLSFADRRPLHQIGADQGLLPAPVLRERVPMSPAERVDLLVDFSNAAGTEIVLQDKTIAILQFRVKKMRPVPSPALATTLRARTPLLEESAAVTRTLTLDEDHEPGLGRMRMLLGGRRWMDPVTERPVLGSVEIWSFVNCTTDIHPVHLHLVRFQVLDRTPFDAGEYARTGQVRVIGPPEKADPGESGWKDTVRAERGMITRIITRFEGYAGRYVWHCHLLEHAANEMMRPFEVLPAPA